VTRTVSGLPAACTHTGPISSAVNTARVIGAVT